MLDRLAQLEKRFNDIELEMASPDVVSNVKRLQELAQERAGIEDVVNLYRQYKSTEKQMEEARSMLDTETDEDMRTLAKQELMTLQVTLEGLLASLKSALLPRDTNDERDVIVEIRAGAGGDEAGLFAADLFRMYSRYALNRGWNVEVIDRSESAIGSIKEIIFEVKGKGAFSRFKYERGVHRVQRVPSTEAGGRIHTSTATVAVLPEAKDVEIDVSPSDLRIDIFHSGGAGGQNVNKVSTAVRLTHLPTGLVVVCQDERSQLRNRQKAMAVLKTRLLDAERMKQEGEISAERRGQVGTGDRAEKIRTYNFPQDRVTDHRIGITMHNLPKLMEGGLDDLIDAVAASEQAKALESDLV
ncbi:MAG: peptide chain release factor 1 [Dehalococcoidia bacterium]|nr:MAG: peptide chain release factor 1 [Dehalococcoidia bacterium]